MKTKKELLGGVLGNYYNKIKNELVNNVDVNLHALTYAGEHDEFYAEPEFTGKYLDLCVKIYKEHGDERALKNAKTIVESIVKNIRDDGYLGCLKKGEEFVHFGVWNQMFTVLGLISYYRTIGDEKALDACEKCIAYVMNYFINEGHDILESENGGSQHCPILFVLSDLYEITRNEKYMEYMNYIIGRFENSDLNFLNFESIFELRSKKGIENFIILLAILKYAKITNNQKAIDSVKKYWQEVKDTQIRNTGNATVYEGFTKDGNVAAYLSQDVKPNETCVAVGWIELSLYLYELTLDKKYLDAVDKTLYNHILASVAEDGSDFAYYQPNFGKKVKSTDTKQYKCCRYRGFTLFTYMADMLVHEDEKCVIPMIYTNTFYESDDIKLTEKTNYPFENEISFEIKAKNEKTLKLRIPEGFDVREITVNGKENASESNGYINIKLEKGEEYVVLFKLNPLLKTEYGVIDNEKVVSFTFGNVLLALIGDKDEIKINENIELSKIENPKSSYIEYNAEGFKNGNNENIIFTDYASADGYTVWIKTQ